MDLNEEKQDKNSQNWNANSILEAVNTILSENICDLLLIWNIFSILEWDSHSHYTFHFYLRMENPLQQVRNKISILNNDTSF